MYYVEENEKIVLYSDNREEIENSLNFMPQYAGLEIKQTDRPIVDFQFADTEEYRKEQERKERERIDMLSLTKREVFLALYKAEGITPEQVKAQVTEPEALIELEYANEYYRGNPLINSIGQKLGYKSEDLDFLFQNKELPAKAPEADTDVARY